MRREVVGPAGRAEFKPFNALPWLTTLPGPIEFYGLFRPLANHLQYQKRKGDSPKRSHRPQSRLIPICTEIIRELASQGKASYGCGHQDMWRGRFKDGGASHELGNRGTYPKPKRIPKDRSVDTGGRFAFASSGQLSGGTRITRHSASMPKVGETAT